MAESTSDYSRDSEGQAGCDMKKQDASPFSFLGSKPSEGPQSYLDEAQSQWLFFPKFWGNRESFQEQEKSSH